MKVTLLLKFHPLRILLMTLFDRVRVRRRKDEVVFWNHLSMDAHVLSAQTVEVMHLISHRLHDSSSDLSTHKANYYDQFFVNLPFQIVDRKSKIILILNLVFDTTVIVDGVCLISLAIYLLYMPPERRGKRQVLQSAPKEQWELATACA